MAVQTTQATEWKAHALAEIASLKAHFIRLYKWQLTTHEEQGRVVLFVRMRHKNHSDRIKVLKLVYDEEFPRKRPRESFVDPNNYDHEGLEFWIDDQNRAFKSNHNPPVICLEGTWGFHSILHRERDPGKANLNKLLLEVQKCFDNTP